MIPNASTGFVQGAGWEHGVNPPANDGDVYVKIGPNAISGTDCLEWEVTALHKKGGAVFTVWNAQVLTENDGVYDQPLQGWYATSGNTLLSFVKNPALTDIITITPM